MKKSGNKELLRFQLSFLQTNTMESQAALFPLPHIWSFPSPACLWRLYPKLPVTWQLRPHLGATVIEHLCSGPLTFLNNVMPTTWLCCRELMYFCHDLSNGGAR